MSKQAPLKQWAKTTSLILAIIGAIGAAIGLVSFLFEASPMPRSEAITALVETYREKRDAFLGPVGDFLRWAFAQLQIEIRTSSLWSESVGVMGAYFFIDFAQNYLKSGRPFLHRLAVLSNGVIVTLVFSLLGDNIAHERQFNIVFPILGFAVYELFKVPMTASLLRPKRWSYWFTVRWYLKYFFGLNLLLGVIVTLPRTVGFQGYNSEYDALVFICFWLLLIIRNFIVTWYRQSYHETDLPESPLANFIGSGSVKIAMTQFVIIVIFFAMLMIDTGLR